MRYVFCPTCGSKLGTRQAGDDGPVPYCEACGKYWFDSFHSCVSVLTYNELDEIVLCRQDYISTKYLSITSGYITPGETAEQAAEREVAEELGLTLESLQYAGTYWYEGGSLLLHGYIGFAYKQPLVLSPEVDEAAWVPALQAKARMYPDRPGNAAAGVYRRYLQMRGLQKG